MKPCNTGPPIWDARYVLAARAIWWRCDRQADRYESRLALPKAGRHIAARTAMMAMTISSSMKVTVYGRMTRDL
ncbi:MAG: hypothetical protein LUO89_00725 [Methanothrix sp.]|nr:hypothetical protein [Methanothrix sp.]